MNRRGTAVTVKGERYESIADAARAHNMSPEVLRYRLKKMSADFAVDLPTSKQYQRAKRKDCKTNVANMDRYYNRLMEEIDQRTPPEDEGFGGGGWCEQHDGMKVDSGGGDDRRGRYARSLGC